MLRGDTCAFIGLRGSRRKSWYKRKLKQEAFFKANYIFCRIVEHQDRPLRVRRFEDGHESVMYPPTTSIEECSGFFPGCALGKHGPEI